MNEDRSTDGCTAVPDFDLLPCCAEHDFYWRNPVGVGFCESNLLLALCIVQRGPEWWRPWIAIIYCAGVTLLGWPVYWRRKRAGGLSWLR